MKYTKGIIVTLFCIGFVLGSASLTFGQGGAPPYAGLNYEKIALLDWYSGNQAGDNQAVSFVGGASPLQVAFDGANIWVTSYDGVTKLAASDGTNLGTFDPLFHGSPVFHGGANYVAFDGKYIWVTNSIDNNVAKLLASDPNTSDPNDSARTFDGHGRLYYPWGADRGVAFDGVHIWVVSWGLESLAELNASDGTLVRQIELGDNPQGLAFDGTNIWWADVGVHGGGYVGKVPISGGAEADFFVGGTPYNLAFDGANIWVTGTPTCEYVTKLRASDGLVLGKFPGGGGCLTGIAFDGANIWVADHSDFNVTKLRASDGANLGTFSVGFSPTGVAFDGANIWVTSPDDGTVSKL